MEKIEVKGIENLNEDEKRILNKLSTEYYEKIKRELKNEVSLKIRLKEYKKDNEKKRRKYSINLIVAAPTRVIEASYADWELAKTLHVVFEKAINEIEKRFHVSEQH